MRSHREALRLLIVDDDADWRAVVCEVLAGMGHEVTTAEDGNAALELLQTERFDAVLLDVLMPELSGEDVAARLPKGAPPVIFMTGLPVDEVGHALAQGPHYYLPKGAGVAEMELMLDSLGA